MASENWKQKCLSHLTLLARWDAVDFVAGYGGEEFVVLQQESGAEAAAQWPGRLMT